MNVFKVTLRLNTDVLGQAATEEELRKDLEDFLSRLIAPEILNIEDMGDAEEFFKSAEADDLVPLPTEPSPTIN